MNTQEKTTKQSRGRPDKPPISRGTPWETLGKYTQDIPKPPTEGKEGNVPNE